MSFTRHQPFAVLALRHPSRSVYRGVLAVLRGVVLLRFRPAPPGCGAVLTDAAAWGPPRRLPLKLAK